MIQIEPFATAVLDAMVLYRNVLSEGTLAWSSQTTDGAAANALGPQTYDFWTPASLPATLSVTLPGAVACDCAAIVAHTMGTVGATAHIEYHDGSSWVTVASVAPADDSDILVLFGEVVAAQWRFRITGTDEPSIGVAMIGPRLLIPNGVQPDYTPINLSLNVELMPSVSVAGQFLGTRVQRQGAGTSINFAPQDRWWIETEAVGFIAHFNSGLPFIWASCPDELRDDMAYCWRAGGVLSASYGAGALYGSMSMDVSAYVP